MGFKVYINGELAKEFDGDHGCVDGVKLLSTAGVSGVLAVPIEMDRVDLEVSIRNPDESNYLDLIERDKIRAQADASEKAAAEAAKAAAAEEKKAAKSTKAAAVEETSEPVSL